MTAYIPRWDEGQSRAGWLLAIVPAGQIVFTLWVVTQPATLGNAGSLFMVALLATLAAFVAIAWMPVPTGIKGLLMFTVLATLLILAVARDPFGVNATASDSRSHTAPALAAASDVAAGTQRAGLAPASKAMEEQVDWRVARWLGEGSRPDAVAHTAITREPGGQAGYRMVWSLERGGTKLWCGTSRIAAESADAAVDAFAERIADALNASRTRPLTCR